MLELEQMREEDFYITIANIVIRDITKHCPDYEIVFSQNNYLPEMIREIEEKAGGKTPFHRQYIPKLKLDILFGVKKHGEEEVSLFLFEVKYTSALQLIHFSQLIGYMDVAKKIKVGVLFLVEKGSSSPNLLTDDFSSVIQSGELTMRSRALPYNEKTPISRTMGICSWREGAKINWYNTSSMGGITSLQEILAYV